jgi:predicted transcriptional regulator
MTPKLSKELSEALDANQSDSLQVVHPHNERTYFIVEGETHLQVMEALQRQRCQEDHTAIAEGIAQLEAGEGRPLDEVFEDVRARLNLRAQQS